MVDLARLFSQLRVLGDQDVKPLTIQEFTKAIEWKELKINLGKLHFLGSNPGLTAKAEALMESFAPITLKTGLTECDGLDAIYILAAATHFFKPRGISAWRKIEAVELFGLLRVSFQLEELETDGFFWRMKKWERQNNKYPLLSDWRELDSLETVWDQRYWQRDLEHLLHSLDPGELLGVLKMDLDNFKIVNDELGHSVGDDAIRHYCSVVKRVVGGDGYVYRRGGDEVVVLLPATEGPRAAAIAEEIRSQIESTFGSWAAERGLNKSPTASVGLVVYSGQSPVEVVELADKAQRGTKNERKNRIGTPPPKKENRRDEGRKGPKPRDALTGRDPRPPAQCPRFFVRRNISRRETMFCSLMACTRAIIFISTAESALAGIAALVPVGSAPELSHKRTGPQLSCQACGTYLHGLNAPGNNLPIRHVPTPRR